MNKLINNYMQCGFRVKKFDTDWFAGGKAHNLKKPASPQSKFFDLCTKSRQAYFKLWQRVIRAGLVSFLAV